jgi:hypothetical protein
MFGAPYLLAVLSIALIVTARCRIVVFSVAAPTIAFGLLVWAYTIRNDPLGIHWLLNTSAGRTTASIGLLTVTLVFTEATMLWQQAAVPIRPRGRPEPGTSGRTWDRTRDLSRVNLARRSPYVVMRGRIGVVERNAPAYPRPLSLAVATVFSHRPRTARPF